MLKFIARKYVCYIVRTYDIIICPRERSCVTSIIAALKHVR